MPRLYSRDLRRFGQPVVPTAPDESSRRRSFGSADVGVEESARLALPQRGVMAAVPQQLLMRALLDDAATLEHDQAVHPGDGGEPMRDGDDGFARHERAQARLN